MEPMEPMEPLDPLESLGPMRPMGPMGPLGPLGQIQQFVPSGLALPPVPQGLTGPRLGKPPPSGPRLWAAAGCRWPAPPNGARRQRRRPIQRVATGLGWPRVQPRRQPGKGAALRVAKRTDRGRSTRRHAGRCDRWRASAAPRAWCIRPALPGQVRPLPAERGSCGADSCQRPARQASNPPADLVPLMSLTSSDEASASP